MCAVYDAIQNQKIHGAFLFSNNSNQSLVQFIGILLETVVQQERGLATRPRLFRMAVSAYSPERGAPLGEKSWMTITRAMRHHHLPLPTTRSDLLFFDDKEHVLTQEITHYKMVPVYHSQNTLADGLRCIQPVIPPSLWHQWNRLSSGAAGTTVATKDADGSAAFMGAIRRFLGTGTRQRRRRRTRKNRRH